MKAVDVRGKFVWHQLMTRDVPGAQKFYSRLTGWTMQPWPPDPNYTVCHAPVGPAAGIMAMPPDMPADVPSHWLQYIGTRDVDGTAEAAVKAGGSIVKPPGDMQGAGRYAVLRDPHGAVFAIIDPENARPEVIGTPPLGTFSWHELATGDNESAFAFYSQLFGWDAITRMDMGPVGTYLIFGWDGQQRGGMYIKPADSPLPPHWLPYVSLTSADDGFAVAQSAGARELMSPMEVPGGGRIAIFIDPVDAPFAVHSMPVAGAAKPKESAEPKPKAKARAKSKAKAKVKRAAPKKQVARKAVVKKKRPAKKTANKARPKQSKSKYKSKSKAKRVRRKK